MVKEPSAKNSQQQKKDKHTTTYADGWQRWLAIATIITTFALAVATTGMACYTAKVVTETARMADQTARMVELTDQALQANLIHIRLQYLQSELEMQRTEHYQEVYDYLKWRAVSVPGAAPIEELAVNQELCVTLGQYETQCRQYHEYQNTYNEAFFLCEDILKDVEAGHLPSAMEKMNNLQYKLNELTRIRREMLFRSIK